MAHARSPALPDRRGAGPACLYGRLLRREGLRRTGLHASLCRPYAWPDATVVQHGALRQSREAGCSPTPVEGAALNCTSSAPRTPTQHLRAHAGTGAAARVAGIGLNVMMIRNAPSPMIQEPI